MAFKPGIRAERSELLKRSNFAPRLALAVGAGQYSQFSFASGFFYEDPDNKYLISGYRPDFQKAVHYILDYQRINNNRTFRIEGYFKSYDQLILENLEKGTLYDGNPYRYIIPGESINNAGHGYAKGVEVFWRDKTSIYNLDYWLSYSYIDSKRLYQNYQAEVTPNFVANNTLNVLVKYFIDLLQVNVGATYTYATGRPSYNPQFVATESPAYQNLAMNMSYLTSFGKYFGVFYIGMDNVLDHKNVFGYQYTQNGMSHPMEPPIYRSFFAGFTISLTHYSKEEL
jgi:hypothetical protein